MRPFLVLAVIFAWTEARADLPAPARAANESCIDDLLSRFMPATVRHHAGASEAVIVYRPDEWHAGAHQKLDVWLPSRKLGRFAITRIKKLWYQDGWVVQARVALPRVTDDVALVALPGGSCPVGSEKDPPFPSADDYKEEGLQPVERPSQLFDLDGDGRPDAFILRNEDGPHSLFLLDRAARRWVRTVLTDVS